MRRQRDPAPGRALQADHPQPRAAGHRWRAAPDRHPRRRDRRGPRPTTSTPTPGRGGPGSWNKCDAGRSAYCVQQGPRSAASTSATARRPTAAAADGRGPDWLVARASEEAPRAASSGRRPRARRSCCRAARGQWVSLSALNNLRRLEPAVVEAWYHRYALDLRRLNAEAARRACCSVVLTRGARRAA